MLSSRKIRIAENFAPAHYRLGLLCLALDDKAGAREAHDILRRIDAKLAQYLLARIGR